jgi:hypothetical protein
VHSDETKEAWDVDDGEFGDGEGDAAMWDSFEDLTDERCFVETECHDECFEVILFFLQDLEGGRGCDFEIKIDRIEER